MRYAKSTMRAAILVAAILPTVPVAGDEPPITDAPPSTPAQAVRPAETSTPPRRSLWSRLGQDLDAPKSEPAKPAKSNVDTRESEPKSVIRQCMDRQDYPSAIREATAILKADPGSPQILYDRAGCFYAIGQFSSALKDMDACVRAAPSVPRPYLLRGDLQILLGRLDLALADFDHVVQLAPKWPEGYGARGHAHFERAEFALALADFNEAVRLGSHHINVLTFRGWTLMNLGEFERAIPDFTEALRAAPLDSGLNAARALCFLATRRYEEAEEDFTFAIDDEKPVARSPRLLADPGSTIASSKIDPTVAKAQDQAASDSMNFRLGRSFARFNRGNFSGGDEDFAVVVARKPEVVEFAIIREVRSP